MKIYKTFIFILSSIFMSFAVSAAESAAPEDSNKSCSDAKIFEKIIDQVCWSCFLPMKVMGVGGNAPDGASDAVGACNCPDKLGVPEVGWPLGGLQPVRLNEVTQQSWCSPTLAGTQLQDSVGQSGSRGNKDGGFYMNYHYFSYPLFKILQILMLGDCDFDAYQSLDLMYMSELDPTWSDDMLSMLLTKEAFLFANPVAQAACVVDGIKITATGKAIEKMFMCAGTDGPLYPLTGHISNTSDAVRNSSLITQRVLAALHRRGLAKKTMGNEEMCKPTYIPFIPRSQYKASIIHPRAEADDAYDSVPVDGGDPENVFNGGKCCHVLGDSVHKWSTAKGGRERPGDTDFVWLIWRWTDCCVRDSVPKGD